jgi:hypothetical protein
MMIVAICLAILPLLVFNRNVERLVVRPVVVARRRQRCGRL